MVTRHAGRARPSFMLTLTCGNSSPAAMQCLSKSAGRAAMAHDPAIVPPNEMTCGACLAARLWLLFCQAWRRPMPSRV
jgi:hypothetical protein